MVVVPQNSDPQAAVNFLKSLPFIRGHAADPGFSQWSLDPRDVLEQMEHTLRGEVWSSGADGKGGAWFKAPGMTPLMNEAGIQYVLREMSATVNRVVIMSNLTEKNVNNILWDRGHDLAADMTRRFWDKNDWDMNRKDFDMVHAFIMLFYEAAIKRAQEDGERKKLYEAQRVNETHVIGGETERRGLLSLIPGLGGRK